VGLGRAEFDKNIDSRFTESAVKKWEEYDYSPNLEHCIKIVSSYNIDLE